MKYCCKRSPVLALQGNGLCVGWQGALWCSPSADKGRGSKSRPAGNLGQHQGPCGAKVDGRTCPAKVPGQTGRCSSAQCVAHVVPLCRRGFCDCLDKSLQTTGCWCLFPSKKPPFCHLLQEALGDSSKCSISTDYVIGLALTRLDYVRLCDLSSEQQATYSLVHPLIHSFCMHLLSTYYAPGRIPAGAPSQDSSSLLENNSSHPYLSQSLTK